MKTFFSVLTVITGTALTLALTGITPAQAITFNFDWNGTQGYSATGSFSYDENTAPAIFSESGLGQTQVLQSLNISFFDPFNNFIAAYNNVVNGISTANYFQFNFNTNTQEIFGTIDFGGEVAGDTYLKGTINTNLSLYQVPQSGSDVSVDSSAGTLTAQAVPEPTATLGLLLFGMAGITSQIKRQSKH
ncbi:MAG TPA: hypothetical protein DCE56_34460 [Cyanobacteria bacterium UBA8553]|nr:hypothetical protein [Cyanobacteria bacterium UBA8553]HAJ63108.1 hypothetical protein [Cyanobacteria bacterium UBA8543]